MVAAGSDGAWLLDLPEDFRFFAMVGWNGWLEVCWGAGGRLKPAYFKSVSLNNTKGKILRGVVCWILDGPRRGAARGPDPAASSTARMKLSNKALVLVDPVTAWNEVVHAAIKIDYTVIGLQLTGATPKFAKFLPSRDALIKAGVQYALLMEQRDVFSSLQQLQILCDNADVEIVGVIPLSEVAVEVADMLSAGLGLPHNPLDLMTARRDKGMMKRAVFLQRVTSCKTCKSRYSSKSIRCNQQLCLSYPVVVKTPAGMSTSDVYIICSNENEATHALHSIVGNIGSDGKCTSKQVKHSWRSIYMVLNSL